mgnify:CR=1 FL=1
MRAKVATALAAGLVLVHFTALAEDTNRPSGGGQHKRLRPDVHPGLSPQRVELVIPDSDGLVGAAGKTLTEPGLAVGCTKVHHGHVRARSISRSKLSAPARPHFAGRIGKRVSKNWTGPRDFLGKLLRYERPHGVCAICRALRRIRV